MPARGQAARLPEDEVKAAFLFNFTKFVEWPPSALGPPGTPFVMAVLDNDSVAAALERLVSGETAKGRPIVVRRFRRFDEVPPCHVLYISETQRRYARDVLRRFQGAPVLTVSIIPGFADMGGIINLTIRRDKLRFVINKAAADRVGLKISSQLLDLALAVRGG